MRKANDARDNMIRRILRLDADEDEDRESPKGHGGNTRIPFGLCKRFNIELPEGASPKDAWNALEGKGISSKAVYQYLEKNGTVKGFSPKVKHGIEYKKYPKAKSMVKAQENLKEKLGIDVDYKKLKGMTVDKANRINDTFLSIHEALDLKPKSIKYDNEGLTSMGADAYVVAKTNELCLCNVDMKANVGWKEYAKHEVTNADEQIEKAKTKYTGKDLEDKIEFWEMYRKDFAESAKYERATVQIPGKELECVITHEMGHVLYNMLKPDFRANFGQGSYEHPYFNAEEYNVYYDAYFGRSKAKRNGDIYKISSYAASSEQEYFAECFAMYMMGEDMPEESQKMIENAVNKYKEIKPLMDEDERKKKKAEEEKKKNNSSWGWFA